MTNRGARVRELFAGDEIVVAPAVYDALGAKLVERAGFDVVYISGFTLAASMGLPDVGLTTLTEVTRAASVIAAAVDVPVMCDVDTGFGSHVNVRRMVRELERAGIAGVKFEDQLTPANRVGRPVVPTEEVVAKLKVAIDARASDDFVVMARTDSAPTMGVDEAIARCQAFEQAGADATHALDLPDEDAMRRVVAALEKPSTGVISLPHPPILSVQELAGIGIKLVVISVPIQFAAAYAMRELLTELRATGDVGGLADAMVSPSLLNELVGLPAVREAEDEYGYSKGGER